MMKDIYLIRHGETDYNRQGRVQGQGIDSSINALGQQQAQAFYETYLDVPFELVVTSGLRRTHQTVEPFRKLSIPFYETRDINEISWGRFEGMAYGDEVSSAYQQMIHSLSINAVRWQYGQGVPTPWQWRPACSGFG